MLGLSAPTVMEKVPALQLMHSAEPDVSLNLPTSQAEQFPPSGPVKPLLQVQLLTDMLPEADHAFDGHAEHCAEPDASLNLPTSQAEQFPPSGVLLGVGVVVMGAGVVV